MITLFYYFRRACSKYFIIVTAGTVVSLMAGCATSLEPGEELLSSDEMLEGPGLFSGEDGEFSIITLNKDGTYARKEKSKAQEIADEDLQGASDILDEKLKELEQQKEELEALKREVNKKLEGG